MPDTEIIGSVSMPNTVVIVCLIVVIPTVTRSRMTSRSDPHEPLAREMRDFLRVQIHERGWSAARIAHEMNELGFTAWTVPVVTGAARADRGRAITIDEYVGLCTIFKRSATVALAEIERHISALNGKGRKRP